MTSLLTLTLPTVVYVYAHDPVLVLPVPNGPAFFSLITPMDLKDTIIKQLSAPVKRKGTQDYMTDEEGNIVTSEAAIGMTIVQKALSGDLQAVAFVLNLQMQQQRDPKTEAEDADRRRQQTEANRNEIRRTLEADNLWTDSLALDLDELAQQKTFIDRLTEQMQAPGYQDTFTLPKKDGTMIPTLNPLHEYRDKAVQKFQAGMERLRAEAIKRKLQARQFK